MVALPNKLTGQVEPLPINIEPMVKGLEFGNLITIKGIRVVGPGRFISGCSEGMETVFIISKLKSVFKVTPPKMDKP